jgi:hypothetical protein
LVLVAIALPAACSSDEDPTDEGVAGGSTTTTFAPLEPPAALPESAPGTGAVAIGGEVHTFTIASCAPSPNLDEPEGARTLFKLRGEGESRGEPITIDVLRFQTSGAATTFTDTIEYRDNARIYQAQRIEVGGTITDLLDRTASTPLVQARQNRVTAVGVFGPPGPPSADRVAFRLDATCVAP